MQYKVGHFYKRLYYVDNTPEGTIIFKVILLGKTHIKIDVVHVDGLACIVQVISRNYPNSKTTEVDESEILAGVL